MEICNFTILGYNGCKFILAAVLAWLTIPMIITAIVVIAYAIYFNITK